MTLALNLPLDIPWKRIAISEDMIARSVLDGAPPRWRSSLIVFQYQPEEEFQTYEGMTVSYLKVIATLTGFQPDGDEVGLRDRRAHSAWFDPAVIEQYERLVDEYYACYGAILEVVILPAGTPEEVRRTPLSRYPYISEFEPKKRELYELVSDTGEVMSRSLESVQVRKGASTTDGHEVMDSVSLSAEATGSAPVGESGAKVGATLGASTTHGTRDLSQQEISNVRTTDAGREMRETFSHTTQLTQMYHQLNSYHLGTNRAMFYVLPRPHIVETPRTFVNGPRVLEGIQEFFLVVMRPKDMKEICVEAYLETAHIAAEPVLDYERGSDTLPLNMTLKAPRPDTTILNDYAEVQLPGEATYVPPDGWEVDIHDEPSGRRPSSQATPVAPGGTAQPVEKRNPAGWEELQRSGDGIVNFIVDARKDMVKLTATIRAMFIDRTFPHPNEFHEGWINWLVRIFIRRKTPVVVSNNSSLWLTGRYVSSCPTDVRARMAEGDFVVWEHPLEAAGSARVGADVRMDVVSANRLRAEIGRLLLASRNHRARYRPGTVKFCDAQFIARTIGTLIRRAGHEDNVTAASLSGLDAALAAKLAKSGAPSRGRVLQMSLEESADRLDLTHDEALRLRRAALGLAGSAPAAAAKWRRPVAPTRPPDSGDAPTPTKPATPLTPPRKPGGRGGSSG